MSAELREEALVVFRSGLAAADPYRLLRAKFREEPGKGFYLGSELGLPLPGPSGRILVLGAGKAVCSLANALEQSLEPRDFSGRVLTKYGHGLPLQRLIVEEAGHPLPDADGVAATKRLLDDLRDLGPEDRIFLLLTGGASSLLVAPAQGLTLEDKIATTELLLRSDATIQEINAVRKHLSTIKGGRLLQAIAPAEVFTIVVSDVIGNDLSSIGSGPTVADPTTFQDCLMILERYGLSRRVPGEVKRHLEQGTRGAFSETLKPGAPQLERARHTILASNRHSLRAAQEKAEALGFETEIFRWDMEGPVHDAARAFAKSLTALLERPRPQALLAGGELTLEVRGSGKGGRNQEFALVASRELQGLDGVAVLSAGTDGTDGPTDAAGALADGTTWSRALSIGLDPGALLANNDAYTLFDRLGDLLRTGPSGTNVNDLVIGLTAWPDGLERPPEEVNRMRAAEVRLAAQNEVFKSVE
ncbi:MAG TPA: glycerate kinase [Anaerolineales bacterium]